MQIDYAVLGAFTLLWLAIVPTPGPNTLLIVHLALTAGWRDVGVALAGNLLAIAFYALATLFGLALLLAAAPSVRLVISCWAAPTWCGSVCGWCGPGWRGASQVRVMR